MFNVSTAPSRVSQRLTAVRARRRALSADRASSTPGRTSLGETFAIGLGCDSYKPRRS
jgi:hypothetical protein